MTVTEPVSAITVGIDTKPPSPTFTVHDSLLELNELARTAGLRVAESFVQQRKHPSKSTYIGSGKLLEIKDYVCAHDIKCLITDDDISPAQSKNLEEALNIKVLDRTGLILDIFALHAKTYEAKLQVELAQLNYLLPRLTRLWTHLSRLGGGIGTRGPGEKQLEVDKRMISKQVSRIKVKLKKIQQDRHVRRQTRNALPMLSGAIVGYTNAGKSTLMNRLTESDVLVANKLFATLDPTSRKCPLPHHNEVVLTDTVGFIQKLPTHLIKAFYSTLEEVTEADFLLHVIDASHPLALYFLETSQSIINDLGAANKPTLYVFNKWDLVKRPNAVKKMLSMFQPHIFISATHESCLDIMITNIQDLLAPFSKTLTFFIPYDRMDIVHLLHKFGDVHNVVYEDKISIKVTINEIIGDKILASLYNKTELT